MARVTGYENLVVVLMGAAFGFVFFDRLALSFLAPFLVPELQLSNAELGALAGGLALTWAIAGYVVGALSDRLQSRKWLLVWAIVIFSACSIGSGLSNSFGALLAARLVMGLAEGPVLPLAQSIMVAESSEHRRGFNMGVLQNFFSSLLSSFVAPLALVAIGQAYGWRNAFYVAAVPGFIVALLIALFIREPAMGQPGERPAGSTLSVAGLLRYRNIWICAIIRCLMIAWLLILLTFLPLYLVQTRGMTPTSMSVVLSVLGLAQAASSLLLPALSDRFGRKPIFVVFAIVAAIAPFTAVAFQGPAALMVVIMGVGFLGTGVFSLFMSTIPAETIPRSSIAGALGFIMGAGEIGGGVAGPGLAGLAADAFGAASPLWIATGMAVASGLLGLALVETAPRIVKPNSTEFAAS